jgi:hypothetical protein
MLKKDRSWLFADGPIFGSTSQAGADWIVRSCPCGSRWSRVGSRAADGVGVGGNSTTSYNFRLCNGCLSCKDAYVILVVLDLYYVRWARGGGFGVGAVNGTNGDVVLERESNIGVNMLLRWSSLVLFLCWLPYPVLLLEVSNLCFFWLNLWQSHGLEAWVSCTFFSLILGIAPWDWSWLRNMLHDSSFVTLL